MRYGASASIAMSSPETSLEPRPSDDLVQIPDEHLRPSSRGLEMAIDLAIYFAIVVPPMVLAVELGWIAMGLFLVLWITRRRRRWFRANAGLREIREALLSDEVERAATLCRDLLAHMPRRGLAHAIAVGNWGVIELRRGRPRQTIVMLERMLSTGRFRGRMGTLLEVGVTTGTLALAHAILGELDAARRRLDEARQQLGPGREDMLFHVRCVLECRAGHFDEVVELIDGHWREAEAKLTIAGARVVRLMEAFALESLGADEYRSSHAERIDRALDRAREARRGAYDYLVVQWPEARAFVHQHALD